MLPPIPYKGCSRGPKLGTYSDWGLSSVLVINKHLSHHCLHLLSHPSHSRIPRSSLLQDAPYRVAPLCDPARDQRVVGEYLCLQNSVFPEISADFPDIARTLTALKTLAMIGYSEYDSFPDNFSGLSSLVTLKLKFLRIEHLPPSITKLHSLKRLLLNKLHIQEMPHDLSTLSN